MADFILQLIIFVSFGIIIYVAARVLPRIPEEEGTSEPSKNFLSTIAAHKVDLAIASFLEKALRRTRLTVLRFDNTLNSYIGKVKSHTANGNGNGKQKSLFNQETNLETSAEATTEVTTETKEGII